MNRYLLPFLPLLTGLSFASLFYDSSAGINLSIWLLLTGALLIWRWPERLILQTVQLTGGMSLLMMAAFTVQGTEVAWWGAVLSFLCFSGAMLHPQLRWIGLGLGLPIFSWMLAPLAWLETFYGLKMDKKGVSSRILYRAMPAAALLLVFTGLFYAGNHKFQELVDAAAEQVFRLLLHFNMQFILLTVLGFVMGIVFLYPAMGGNWAADQEGMQPDRLVRVRRQRYFTLSGLRAEYKIALYFLVPINLLAGLVNGLDLMWLWISWDPDTVPNLSQFVHEGTWMLVASILLSMGLMFWIYRENQHFFKGNRYLRGLCDLWIYQNVFMALSVLRRNLYYVDWHGLAYKRIGVFFFLLLTLTGLVLLWIKIHRNRTLWWVIRRNTLIGAGVFCVAAWVNWGAFIARYNFAHWDTIYPDTQFMLQLPDAALPVLVEHRDKFNTEGNEYVSSEMSQLDERVAIALERWEERDWRSWTWGGERLAHDLQTHLQTQPQ